MKKIWINNQEYKQWYLHFIRIVSRFEITELPKLEGISRIVKLQTPATGEATNLHI